MALVTGFGVRVYADCSAGLDISPKHNTRAIVIKTINFLIANLRV